MKFNEHEEKTMFTVFARFATFFTRGYVNLSATRKFALERFTV